MASCVNDCCDYYKMFFFDLFENYAVRKSFRIAPTNVLGQVSAAM